MNSKMKTGTKPEETEVKTIPLNEGLQKYFKELIMQRNEFDARINRELSILVESHVDATGKKISFSQDFTSVIVEDKKA